MSNTKDPPKIQQNNSNQNKKRQSDEGRKDAIPQNIKLRNLQRREIY